MWTGSFANFSCSNAKCMCGYWRCELYPLKKTQWKGIMKSYCAPCMRISLSVLSRRRAHYWDDMNLWTNRIITVIWAHRCRCRHRRHCHSELTYVFDVYFRILRLIWMNVCRQTTTFLRKGLHKMTLILVFDDTLDMDTFTDALRICP